ncbi:MAG TPA: hybrid sensor histidine kinase/response regulator [Alphaproteobacteria bacterium]|jgi:signal transduction histidine kinase
MATILILDDRNTNRKILAQLAGSVEPGVSVKACASGEEGIAAAKAQPPDLVFSDFNMPGMNGAEFVAAFRKLNGCIDVPVIVVTAYEDREHRYRALEAGATDFLASPVDHHEFVVRARNLLALRRQSLARQAAERANAAKTAFLANMSHELRTPLNAIIGFSEIMQTELHGPLGNAKYKDYSNDIGRSARHLREVIQNILDVARIEEGKFDVERALVGVPVILEDAARMVRPEAERAKLAFDVAVPSDLPYVLGDKTKLTQAFLNLMSNAVKFTPAGGQVSIAAHKESDTVEVTVGDTGIGMSPEEIPIALARFGQVSGDPYKKKYQGAGLGLPIAAGIIQAHRGQLLIDSAKGRGTRMTVRLPAAAAVLETIQ